MGKKRARLMRSRETYVSVPRATKVNFEFIDIVVAFPCPSLEEVAEGV
jgi:hypothetical protein